MSIQRNRVTAGPTARTTASLGRAPMTGLGVALAAVAIVMCVKMFGNSGTARLAPGAITAIGAFGAAITSAWVTISARRFGATRLHRDFVPNVLVSSYYRRSGIDGVPLSARRSQQGKRNRPEKAADNDRQMVKVYSLSGNYGERML